MRCQKHMRFSGDKDMPVVFNSTEEEQERELEQEVEVEWQVERPKLATARKPTLHPMVRRFAAGADDPFLHVKYSVLPSRSVSWRSIIDTANAPSACGVVPLVMALLPFSIRSKLDKCASFDRRLLVSCEFVHTVKETSDAMDDYGRERCLSSGQRVHSLMP